MPGAVEMAQRMGVTAATAIPLLREFAAGMGEGLKKKDGKR